MEHLKTLLHKIRASKYFLCLTILFLLILVLNLAALNQTFCDGYTSSVYGILSDFFGRLTAVLPFPAGEIFMYLAGLFLITALFFSLLLIFLRKSEAYVKFMKIYLKSLLLTAALFLFTYTLQWNIPFRSSLLGKPEDSPKQYSTEDLRKLWLYTVDHLNNACTLVPRDKDGHVIFSSKEDMEQKTIQAMKNISDEYPRLKGYYPAIKPALCSDVLKWMNIGGYTYPYTMELTYNKYITDLYFPTLYAHESAHHQGYYQENEANFLSFLACAGSNDPVLRYSAFHTIYFYVDDAYSSALADTKDETLLNEYRNTKISEQILLDEKEERKKAENSYASHPHPLQKYSETAKDAADAGWSTQSNVLKENGYDGVVQLLLEYYDYSGA